MDNLLIVSEIAKFLRVSAGTIYRLVEAGKIPHFRIDPLGKKSSIRFSISAIEEWAEKQSFMLPQNYIKSEE